MTQSEHSILHVELPKLNDEELDILATFVDVVVNYSKAAGISIPKAITIIAPGILKALDNPNKP